MVQMIVIVNLTVFFKFSLKTQLNSFIKSTNFDVFFNPTDIAT